MIEEKVSLKKVFMNVIRYIHEWTCENSNIVFFNFPMINIRTENFYKKISDEIENLNCVPIEVSRLKGLN